MATFDEPASYTEPKEISWRAAPFARFERTPVWYATLAAVALVLVGISIWQRNPFFALFVVFATILVAVLNRTRPSPLEFGVDAAGVRVGSSRYAYTELTQFAYRSRQDRLDEVLLHRKSVIGSHLHLPVDAKLGANVRNFLAVRLPEVEYHESFIELFSDLLGF